MKHLLSLTAGIILFISAADIYAKGHQTHPNHRPVLQNEVVIVSCEDISED